MSLRVHIRIREYLLRCIEDGLFDNEPLINSISLRSSKRVICQILDNSYIRYAYLLQKLAPKYEERIYGALKADPYKFRDYDEDLFP